MSEFKFSFDISSSSNKGATSCEKISTHASTILEIEPSNAVSAHQTTNPLESGIITTIKEKKDDEKNTLPNNVQILDISLVISNMTSLPHEWKRDRLILSGTKSNAPTATTTKSTTPDATTNIINNRSFSNSRQIILEKIDIHQQPFQSNCTRKENAITKNEKYDAIKKDSDIIPGYYEGGLKLWECSVDLCNYLSFLIQTNHGDMQNVLKSHDRQNRHVVGGAGGGRVLELGCGHGLPACLVLQELLLRQRREQEQQQQQLTTCRGCSPPQFDFKVVFSDYNEFVLRDVTLPNILINCNNRQTGKPLLAQELEQCCCLVAGDWMALSQLLLSTKQPQPQPQPQPQGRQRHNMPGKFDLILAAETTYTVQSARETAYLLLHHLEPNVGVAFVAMKRYYFGVGGGSDTFCSACHDYGLEAELMEVFQDGKSNIRDLWRVKLKQTTSG